MTVDLEALRALAAKSAALIAECPFNAPGYRAEKCKRCGATQSDTCGVHDSATNQFYNTMSVAFPALADEIERLRAWKAEALAVESMWDVQAIGKLLGVRYGGNIRPAIQPGIENLRELLTRAREHIDGEIDVIDGDYGEPHPNAAMILASAIDAALGEAR